MFRQVVANILPYTDDHFKSAFKIGEIQRYEEISKDKVLLSVMRALISPRDNENKYFLKYIPFRFLTQEDLQSPRALTIVESLQDIQIPDGWEELRDIEMFIHKALDGSCQIYANKELCSAIVFGPWDAVSTHLYAAFVPRFFGPLFAEHKLTRDEYEMLDSLCNNTSSFYDFMSNIHALPYGARLIREDNATKLKMAAKDFAKAQLDRAEREMNNAMGRIQQMFERYQNALDESHEANIRYNGLLAMSNNATEDQQIYEHLANNENIDVLSYGNGIIEIIIRTYLDLYDADAFEQFSDAFFRNICNSGKGALRGDSSRTKRLLSSIFSNDPVFHVRTCGYYNMNMIGSVRTSSGYAYPTKECRDRIPNPHLQRYACLGQYEVKIQQAMQSGDLLATFLQCEASASSINVPENATFEPFCKDLVGTNIRCLERISDGKQFSPQEADQYLQELEDEQKAKEAAE